MSVKKRSSLFRQVQPESGLIYGFGLLIVLAATWFTFQFIEPAPPRVLSIATGNPDGAYHHFGLELQQHLAAHGVKLNVVSTDGSIDNIERLNNGDVDVAFIQSGLASSKDYPEFESLGAMYVEPVWVFSLKALELSTLRDLGGKAVAAGGAGSGTRSVALRLLSANGLSESDLDMSTQSGMPAVDALRSGNVDVIISVASISAPMIDTLLNDTNTQLISLDRAPAYARREPWLMHLTLPEGVVDLKRNLPSDTIDLLAVNATLVGTEKLHPALRDLLLRASDEIFSEATLLSGREDFPSINGSDFPLSSDAIRFHQFGPPFLQRYLPFWIANLVDRLKLLALPLVALLLPLSRLLPPAYRWAVRKKIYRWYDEVQDLDKSASADLSEVHQMECAAELRRIENEVRGVKVPLSYAHELYGLRQHVELLLRQIDARVSIKNSD